MAVGVACVPSRSSRGTAAAGSCGARVPAYRTGAPAVVAAHILAASDDRGELQKLAFWLHERWGVNSTTLGIWFGLPRSTAWGWVRRFEGQPGDIKAFVLADLDEHIR